MTPQLTHDSAARILRILAYDQDDTETFDAYEFVLDELTAAHNKADLLLHMLDKLRREYAQLISDNLREQGRNNQAAVRAVAERGK